MKNRVEFVSYSGEYPCLCVGDLVLRIDGREVIFTNALCSGGGLDEDYNAYEGEWSVCVPEEYKHLRDEIEGVVNANIEYGCCGGCI